MSSKAWFWYERHIRATRKIPYLEARVQGFREQTPEEQEDSQDDLAEYREHFHMMEKAGDSTKIVVIEDDQQ